MCIFIQANDSSAVDGVSEGAAAWINRGGIPKSMMCVVVTQEEKIAGSKIENRGKVDGRIVDGGRRWRVDVEN